ncbi:MAG TPA: adenylate/guanylate cyclase domain-containing protein [Candidatus Limnocylindrales bacterium]|nr:adenylate/guanylate cyclase domain-containing protein [Candidatus Limnocylindrales bacterium]
MPMACSVCGNPLPAGARFCPSCGASTGHLLATEERKMVTVLFADLVDSTGLARRLDAESARDVLSEFFDAAAEELHALRGRPEKFIGDAVMAVFGLPHVQEDDALRAIRAGLAIRGRARRLGRQIGPGEHLEVRVGIESGEAATGVGPAGQLLVTGQVVNTAARLQAAAQPGQLLSGPIAHTLTADKVVFGRKRRIRAKGFDSSLEAYPVEGLTTRSTRRTIPFVGRINEQAILGESLGLASTTGKPVLVTIIGEPGIGKSRMADELAAGLSATVRVLRGQARSYTDSATFSPAAAIVADLAGIDDPDSPEVVRNKLSALVAACCPPADVRRVTERLALLFGASQRRREESTFVQDVQAGFIELLDGLARDHPVLLIFDDAHTMRPAMLDLIERVGTASRRGPRRALVLAIARRELLDERPAWGKASSGAVLIRVDPLTIDESIRLVRHASGGRISETESTAIAKRAGGNPFFIIETTGMLLGSSSGSPGRRIAIPPTVQAIVEARLDALPGRLRDLARHASIFMYGFDLDELQVVDPAATDDELLQLEEAEVVVRQPQSPAGLWAIRHTTLKEIAYASLPKRERVRLHRNVAQRLLTDGHPSWAADHLELGARASLDLDPDDRAAPEEAADALLVAGDRARRRMESRSAVDRYKRSLALSGPEGTWGVREARALAGMGEALYWLGEYRAAKSALERAVAIGEGRDDAFALALALRFLGDIAINFEGDVDKAEQLLQRSLAAAERLGDPWAVVRSLVFAGWVPWTRGRYDEAETTWRRALEVADADDYWARVRALNALSINRSDMQDPEAALRLVEEAGRLAQECGDQFSFANTAVQKARVFDDLGRREEALEWFDRGIAVFADLGARWEEADATAARGIAKRELGRLDEAEEDLRFAIRVAEELGDRQLPAWTWRALARVSELRGDEAEAAERRQRSDEAETLGPH